jgi:hypothetical protein
MNPTERWIRKLQGWALVLLPALLMLVFLLHFRRPADFFDFHLTYTPRSAERSVTGLVAAGAGRPVLHDPHMLAYLGLPLFLLSSFGLYALGRRERPRASLVGLATAAAGTIYIGGLFGAWTAFFGIGTVDPKFLDGAIASFAALTAPRGALLITTTLSKLTMVGLGIQALALLGRRGIPRWAPLAVTAGCVLFLLFWDLDNWMFIAAALMLAGFLPMKARLGEADEQEM